MSQTTRQQTQEQFHPVVTMVTTPLVGLVHVVPHALSLSHLMKTSIDIASTSLYLLLTPINEMYIL